MEEIVKGKGKTTDGLEVCRELSACNVKQVISESSRTLSCSVTSNNTHSFIHCVLYYQHRIVCC